MVMQFQTSAIILSPSDKLFLPVENYMTAMIHLSVCKYFGMVWTSREKFRTIFLSLKFRTNDLEVITNHIFELSYKSYMCGLGK